MNLQNVFKDISYIAHCVPLAIEPLGIVYMNDIGTWVITINSTHMDCVNKSISIAQLLHLFKTNSSYFSKMKDTYEQTLPTMITCLEQIDQNERISF